MRNCDLCKKGTVIQKSGAHQYGGGWAMRATKKRKVWHVNLHNAKVTFEGVRRTMRLCTKCLKLVKSVVKIPTKNKIPQKKSSRVAVAAAV